MQTKHTDDYNTPSWRFLPRRCFRNICRPLVFVVCFYPSGDCQYFNFKIFHFVVKDIPVQIWYKLSDISSGKVVSAKMKKCDTTLSIVPHNCLVFLTHPVRKAIKNGCWNLSSTRFYLVYFSELLHFFLYNRYWLSGFSIFVVQLWNKIRDFPHNLTGNTFKELSAKVRKYPTPDAVMMF